MPVAMKTTKTKVDTNGEILKFECQQYESFLFIKVLVYFSFLKSYFSFFGQMMTRDLSLGDENHTKKTKFGSG